MNRTDKYKLKRTLIELENITESLISYINYRDAFDRLLGNPMERLMEWIG